MVKKSERHQNPELFLPEVSDSLAPSTKTRCKASKHHQKQQKSSPHEYCFPCVSQGRGLLGKLLLLEVSFKSYFMKLLLDKKYALPYRVLDAVVAHFMSFLEDTRIMPVIWQQSLLSFVQRYKNELQKEDKDNLRQKHKLVSPKIIRELDNSRNRGEKDDPMSLNIFCMQN